MTLGINLHECTVYFTQGIAYSYIIGGAKVNSLLIAKLNPTKTLRKLHLPTIDEGLPEQTSTSTNAMLKTNLQPFNNTTNL